MNSSAQINPSGGGSPHEAASDPSQNHRIEVASPEDPPPGTNITVRYRLPWPWKQDEVVLHRQFADKSLWFITPEHRIRKFCAYVTLHPFFDSFILTVILLNAAFMLFAEYDKIRLDVNRDNPKFGTLDGRDSVGNQIQLQSDIYFTVTFTIELVLKVIARGFIGEEGCYTRDPWNLLDFLVVVTAWIPMALPDVPSVSVIRTFRVLRPLKSVSALPELQKIIRAMLGAIPQLMYVFCLLVFTYSIFGILGLQLFSGNMHHRCRLTPYPVTLDWQEGLDYEAYACLKGTENSIRGTFTDPADHNLDTLSASTARGYDTKASSPWNEGFPGCYWPLDEDVGTLCNLDSPKTYDPNSYRCYHGDVRSDWRWCGSDFDYFGNRRFIKGPQTPPYLDKSIYYEDLLWGFMTFDNLARALLTIFQSVTMEAWSDIMYMCMDSSGFATAGIYFVLLMLLGSFFALNLVLAVLENSFDQEEEGGDEEGTVSEAAGEGGEATHEPGSGDEGESHGAALGEHGTVVGEDADPSVAVSIKDGAAHKYEVALGAEEGEPSVARRLGILERLSLWIQDENGGFSWFITFLIVVNTVVLAMDKYPSTPEYDNVLGVANLILTFAFAGEMVLKIVIMKPSGYVKDRFNVFDALVVVISFVEFFMSDDSGGLTALRSFRLFRIFKLARKWQTMQRLLQLIVTTLVDVSNFLLLVCLFIFIYAMLGIEFFANRMRFDDQGYAIPLGGEGYEDAYVPRHNFDTVLNAIVTVYQILSGENWNVVMYDGWRATNWVATLYFVSLVVLGALFVMNLFLAILLNNFDVDESSDEEDKDKEERGVHEAQGDAHMESDASAKSSQEPASDAAGAVTVVALPSPSKGARVHPAAGLSAADEETESNQQRPGVEVSLHEQAESPPVEVSSHGPATSLSRVISTREKGVSLTQWVASAMSDASRAMKAIPEYTSKDHLAEQVELRTQARLAKVKAGTATEDSVFPLKGQALGWFGPSHPMRHFSALVVDHPYFDRMVLLLIVVSSALLAVDTPFLDPKSDLKAFLNAMDVIMTVLFSMEMIFKFMAMGLYHRRGGGGYFQSGWNILDFVVVMVSITSLTPAGDGLSWFKAIRTLRTLRPLRMINRAPGLKVIVNSILASIPEIMNVTAVCLFMFLIFAIFSVNYFKGQMRGCQGAVIEDVVKPNATFNDLLVHPKPWGNLNNGQRNLFGPNSPAFTSTAQGMAYYGENAVGWLPDGTSPPLCDAWVNPGYPQTLQLEKNFDYATDKPTSRLLCECWGGEWEQVVPQRFDHTIWAFLTLFEISTTEGWVDVMWAVVDSTGIDMEPIENHQEAWVWFFMLFIFLGSYLFLNLFVGVTIDNFNRIKSQKDGESIFMTSSQRMWVDTLVLSMKVNLRKTITMPTNAFGRWCYSITEQAPNAIRFEKFIMACIVGNTLIMACDFFGQPDSWTTTTEYLNLIFAGIFTVEAVMKIAAQRGLYFADNWNNFDFSIVLLTIAGLIVTYSGNGSIGSMPSIVRTFRVARAMRLINGMTEVKRLFKTLMVTLPAVLNILTLLVLLFFIFTIVGNQLFATVALNGANDQHTNLRYFFRTFIVLLRFSTGENWNGFMHSVATDVEGCIREPSFDKDFCGYNDNFDCLPLNGCGNTAIYGYMLLFNVVIAFVFVNLFIGVILEGFDQSDDAIKLVKDEDFEYFNDVWKLPQFDSKATCFLSPHLLPSFSRALLCGQGVSTTSFAVIRDHWGLGESKSVPTTKLEALVNSLHTSDTPIKILDHEGQDAVHFRNVLAAFVKQAVRLHLEAKGQAEDIDLPQNAQNQLMMRNLISLSVGGALGNDMFDSVAQHYTLQHRHAAVVIYRTVMTWRSVVQQRRALQGKGLGKHGPKASAGRFDQATPHEAVAGWDASSANGLKRVAVSTSEAASQTPKDGVQGQSSRRPDPTLDVLNKVQPGATARQLPALPQVAGVAAPDASSVANLIEEDPSEAADSLL